MTIMDVLFLPSILNCHKSPLRLKLCQDVRLALEAEILGERATIYVTGKFPALYVVYTG